MFVNNNTNINAKWGGGLPPFSSAPELSFIYFLFKYLFKLCMSYYLFMYRKSSR